MWYIGCFSRHIGWFSTHLFVLPNSLLNWKKTEEYLFIIPEIFGHNTATLSVHWLWLWLCSFTCKYPDHVYAKHNEPNESKNRLFNKSMVKLILILFHWFKMLFKNITVPLRWKLNKRHYDWLLNKFEFYFKHINNSLINWMDLV